MDDIDKTFNILRRISYHSMKLILFENLIEWVWVEKPTDPMPQLGHPWSRILEEHFWTLDEFNKESVNDRIRQNF